MRLVILSVVVCVRRSQWCSQGGPRGSGPPILRTKHKHTYKLHKICQYSQFIFGKITKTVATRSHLLKLKCSKYDFGWNSAPDPAGGAHSAPLSPCLDFRGPTSKGKDGGEKEKAWEERGGAKGGGHEGKRQNGKGEESGRKTRPPVEISGYTTGRFMRVCVNVFEAPYLHNGAR